jgi:gamma-glutamylputrescine oxidase
LETNTFSYWERTAFIDGADVIIIGSGIVGLSAALHLKTQQPLLKVLVLERGFLPTGASTKNAGFACFGTVSEQLKALEHASEAEVASLVNYKWRGLQRLRKNLAGADIDFQQNGGYELFMNDERDKAEYCKSQVELLNKLLKDATGLTDIYSAADAKIADFGFKGVCSMICNPYEGQLHTGKMMRALLDKVYSVGVIVLNNCAIGEINNQGSFISLATNREVLKQERSSWRLMPLPASCFPD